MSTKRRRGNDGQAGHIERGVGGLIRRSLVDAVCPPEPPPVRRPPKIYHGPKPSRGTPDTKLSDETVLQIRAIREFRGISCARIAAMFDLDPMRVQNLCEYTTRGHLVPTRADLPPE